MSTMISDAEMLLLAIYKELQDKIPNFKRGIHKEVGIADEYLTPVLIDLEKDGYIKGIIWVKDEIDLNEVPSYNNISLTPSGLAKVIELLN
jgi:hypothetical protein